MAKWSVFTVRARLSYYRPLKLGVIRFFLPVDGEGFLHPFLLSEEEFMGEKLHKEWGVIPEEETYKGYRTRMEIVKGEFVDADDKFNEMVSQIRRILNKARRETGARVKFKLDLFVAYRHWFSY